MKINQIKVILKKEFKETLRDKRTLFITIILPIILYPVLIIGISQLSIFQVQKIQEKTFKIDIEGEEFAPGLVEQIEDDSQFVIVDAEDPVGSIKAEKIHLNLVIPEGFEDSIANEKQVSVKVYYDGAVEESEAAQNRLSGIIREYRVQLVEEWVSGKGLNAEFVRPIDTDWENIATPKKMGAYFFGGILAFFVIVMVITGAYYPSIDMFAGEKERGTLETLLVSPAGRLEIVVGKYLTVFILAMITAVLNLASMGITLTHGMFLMEKAADIKFSIDITSLLSIFVILVPLAALFSAIFISLSAFAKSYKEAQSYLTPLFIISELPAMIVLLPGMQLTNAVAFIPVVNVALLFKEMLMGKFIAAHVIFVFLSMSIYAALALKWASKLLRKEDVLVGDKLESPFKYLFRKRTIIIADYPNMGDSIFLFIFCLLLLWFIGQPLQLNNIITGLIITELALVFLPSLILCKKYGITPSKLGLSLPSLRNFLLIIPLAVAGFVVGSQTQVFSSWIFPPPTDYIGRFTEMLGDLGDIGLWNGLLVISILPGICEEFLFRGYIQTGLVKKWGKVWGVLVASLLFAVFHLDPYRFLGVFILGIILGIIFVSTGSLLLSMLAHVLINGTSFCLSYFGTLEQLEQILEDKILFVALFLLSITLVYILLRLIKGNSVNWIKSSR
ncbi:CPBP family intramembrane metalloprotease [bacterium]|nr:CPBP family intramembrane metalloprotease [bacterium]